MATFFGGFKEKIYIKKQKKMETDLLSLLKYKYLSLCTLHSNCPIMILSLD